MVFTNSKTKEKARWQSLTLNSKMSIINLMVISIECHWVDNISRIMGPELTYYSFLKKDVQPTRDICIHIYTYIIDAWEWGKQKDHRLDSSFDNWQLLFLALE